MVQLENSNEMKDLKKKPLSIIGWREWVSFPELNIKNIKAKIDTGARTSSLHAFDLKFIKKNKKEYVEFKVHPKQRDSHYTINCRAEVIDYRKVVSSNGHSELRPVIRTQLKFGDEKFDIELTLTNRSVMGFRLLLGRTSLKSRYLIDVSKSYLIKKNGEK